MCNCKVVYRLLIHFSAGVLKRTSGSTQKATSRTCGNGSSLRAHREGRAENRKPCPKARAPSQALQRNLLDPFPRYLWITSPNPPLARLLTVRCPAIAILAWLNIDLQKQHRPQKQFPILSSLPRRSLFPMLRHLQQSNRVHLLALLLHLLLALSVVRPDSPLRLQSP